MIDDRNHVITKEELDSLPRRPLGTSPRPLVAGDRWIEVHEDQPILAECERVPDDEHTRGGVALRRYFPV